MKKYKFLKPVAGFAYFPGDVAELDEKKVSGFVKSNHIVEVNEMVEDPKPTTKKASK